MTSVPLASSDDLRRTLERISGRGYKAYKDIEGGYQFPGFILLVDHVQGDPFAAPSRVRVRVRAERAGFPGRLFSTAARRTGLEDLSREVEGKIKTMKVKRDSLGDIYFYLACETEESPVESRSGESAGFDSGLRTFFKGNGLAVLGNQLLHAQVPYHEVRRAGILI
jgi:hypothetical protein